MDLVDYDRVAFDVIVAIIPNLHSIGITVLPSQSLARGYMLARSDMLYSGHSWRI